nr:MAG TPA: hypothetical protein [Caudoviricetes sp.]
MSHKESLTFFFDQSLIILSKISKTALYSLLNVKI